MTMCRFLKRKKLFAIAAIASCTYIPLNAYATPASFDGTTNLLTIDAVDVGSASEANT